MTGVNDKMNLNGECGLLLPDDYPTSSEINILIGA